MTNPVWAEAYDRHRDLRGHHVRSACYAPIASMYFDAFGNVTACCQNTRQVLGNVRDQSISDIWRGEPALRLRQAVRDYDLGVGCEFCQWQLDDGNVEATFATSFDDLAVSGSDPPWPTQMEFALSNSCNLECVMCHGDFSSSIRAHREHRPPLPKVYGDRYFEELAEFLPHLHRARFFGGEPFLAEESFRVFELLLAQRSSVPCNVTTNGTQWNERIERVLDGLPVSIGVSLDGVTPETVESVRLNASFGVVLTNLVRFRRYTERRGTVLSLTFCLMRPNWHEFGDFLAFADDLGCSVFVNTVVYPPRLSLYRMGVEELRGVLATLEGQTPRFSERLGLNRRVWFVEIDRLRRWLDRLEAREGSAPPQTGRRWYFEDHVEDPDLAERTAARAVAIRNRR